MLCVCYVCVICAMCVCGCLLCVCVVCVLVCLTMSLWCFQLAEGVGLLLFEVCKGVPMQFHTCTAKVSRSPVTPPMSCDPPPPQVLPLLLSLMGDAHLPTQEMFRSLTIMVELMAEHTRREHASLLWDCLLVGCDQLGLYYHRTCTCCIWVVKLWECPIH